MIVTLFVPFIFWILINTTFTLLSKKRFAFCMPFSMIFSAMVLFCSQFVCKSFNPGMIMLAVCAAAAVPLFFVRRKKINIKTDLLLGLLIFAVIYVLYFVMDLNHHFQIYDEWYHWGTMVKECFRLDQFYSVPDSNLWLHKDYPPFMCLLELVWCKLCGGYNEMRVLMAAHIFTLTLVMGPVAEVFTDKLCRKETNTERDGRAFIKKLICPAALAVFFLIIIFAFDPYGDKISTTIIVDTILPAIFACLIVTVFLKRNENLDIYTVIYIIALETALLLTKQVGIAFVLVADLFFILMGLFKKHTSQTKKLLALLKYAAAVIIPLIPYKIWSLYIKSLSIEGQFSVENIEITEYINAWTGVGIRHDTLKMYLQALFKTDIGTISWLPVTFASSLIIILLLTAVLYYLFRDNFTLKNAVIIGISFTVGTAGYAFLMSVMYLFGFNEEEMAVLASYSRYMASYVLGEILVLVMTGLICIAEKTDSASCRGGNKLLIRFSPLKRFIVVVLIVMIGLNPANMYYLLPQAIQGNPAVDYEEDADQIRSVTEAGDRIFVVYDAARVDPSWWGAYQPYLQYFLNDRIISHAYTALYKREYTKELTDSISDVLQDNDFLYIRDTNDAMEKLFYDISGIIVEAGTLYRIENNADGLALWKAQ